MGSVRNLKTRSYAVALPRGLALDPANGMITGIPTASASGSYGVTATYGQDSGVTSVSVVVIEILARDVPPGPPVLDSVDPKDKTATVSWTAPEAKGYLGKTEAEGVITGYRVYYAKGAGPTKTSFSRLIPGETAVSADISGLTNGGGYFFAVAAVTDAGEGELSNALEAAAAKPGKLARPSVVPVPGNGEVRVSWLPPRAETAASMPDPEKYAIYYAKGAAPVKDDGNTTKIEITDLTTLASIVSLAKGSYYFAVTAINSVGEGDLSDATEAEPGDPTPLNSVPAAPWNVEAVAGDGAITVTWTDPADTGIFNGAKADITEFKVYYSENTIDDNTDLSQLSSEQFASLDQERSVEVSGLTNLRPYFIAVAAVNREGEGDLSNPVSSTPTVANVLPGAPGLVVAVAGDGRVTVNWTVPADPGFFKGVRSEIRHYKVYYAQGEDPTKDSVYQPTFFGNTETVLFSLENLVTYHLAVAAITEAGEGPLSNVETAEPKEANRAPGAPVQTAAVLGMNEVKVRWTAPVDTGIKDGRPGRITGYKIYYEQGVHPTKASLSELITDGSALTGIVSLSNGGDYYFAVAAVTASGEGALSNVVDPDRPPGRLGSPSVVPGDGRVRITWAVPVDTGIHAGSKADITGYRVYYAEAADGLDNAVPREVADFAQRDEVSLEISFLTNGVAYVFAVAATNGWGEGPRSDVKEATPSDGAVSNQPPDVPANVRVTAGDGALTVTWTDPADTGIFNGVKADITEFKVYYSENTIDGNTDLSQLLSKSFTSLDQGRSVEVSGLSNGRTYHLALVTVTEAGNSPLLIEQGTPKSPDTPAEAPSGVAAVFSFASDGRRSVRVEWTAPDDTGTVDGGVGTITGYRIYYALGAPPTKEFTLGPVDVAGDVTGGNVFGLSTGSTYYFAVATVTGAGVGDLSPHVEVSPLERRAPGAPKQLDPQVLGPTDVKVAWETPADSGLEDGQAVVLTGYEVYYRERGGETLTKDNSAGSQSVADGGANSADVGGLKANTDYDFAVAAVNAVGEGSLSQIKTVRTADLTDIKDTNFSITADDKIVTVVTADSHSVTIGGSLTAGTDYTLSISGGTTVGAVTIDAAGNITITNAIALADAGTYTVTATGRGNYTGTVEATFTLTVNSRAINSVSYASITATYNTSITAITPTKDPPGLTATYSASNLPTGLSVNSTTGEISGIPTALQTPAANFTIAVRGAGEWAGTNYNATVSITVSPRSLVAAGLTIGANAKTVTSGTGGMSSVTIGGGLTAGTDYTLSIAKNAGATPGAISIGSGGAITITTAIALADAGDYTVTATGQGNYTGTVTDTFTLTVNSRAINSVSYAAITATYDTAITAVAPTKDPTGLTATYSASNLPTGLSVNSTTGEISGTPTALQTTAADFTIVVTGTGEWAGTNYNARVSITVSPRSLVAAGLTIAANAITVTAGTAGMSPVTIGGSLTAGTDYTLSIAKNTGATPGAISIGSGGAIAITNAIALADAGTYTVTATGRGNYTGIVTNTFTLRVNSANLGTFSYTDQTVDVKADEVANGGDLSLTADTTNLDTNGGTITYAITRRTANSGASGDVSGIGSVNSDGTLTITDTTAIPMDVTQVSFEVTATPGNTNYAPVTATVVVSFKKVTGISFGNAPTPTYGDTGVSVSAGGTVVNGADAGVTYSSETPAIATVDPRGLLTILGAGMATIRATSGFDASVTETQDITIAAKSVNDLTFGGLSIQAYESSAASGRISVTGGLVGGDTMAQAVDFTAQTNAPFSVDTTGQVSIADTVAKSDNGITYSIAVTGKGNYGGTRNLTFTLDVSGKQNLGTFGYTGQTVDVKADAVANSGDLTLTADTTNLDTNGGTIAYAITGRTANSGASGDVSGIGSINASNGALTITDTTAIPGDVTQVSFEVTATPGNTNYAPVTATVVVRFKKVTGISFGTVPTLTYGDTGVSVSAAVTVENNADTGVTYSSSNTNVVTVDSNGNLTTAGAGTATITAASAFDTTKTATQSLTVDRATLTGTVAFADTTATSGTGGSHGGTVTFTGLTAGTDYTLSIAKNTGATPGAISIGSGGAITITNAIALADAGTYTVTATGRGNYTGTVTDTFNLRVAKAINSVSYAAITTIPNTAITAVTPTKDPTGLTATYSAINLPTGLSVNSATGEISGTPTAFQTTADFTIAVAGTGEWAGTNYNAAVSITVGADVSGFTINDLALIAYEGVADNNLGALGVTGLLGTDAVSNSLVFTPQTSVPPSP